MTSNPTRRFAALLVMLFAATACKREEPSPTDTPQAATPAATPVAAPADDATSVAGTDAVSVTPATQAQSGVQQAVVTVAGVEPRDFAGHFAAEGTALKLDPDGTYAISAHAASADADLKDTGTWTVEAKGKELLLDSEDKSEPDRRYTVVSKDELKANAGGQVLRRSSAP